MIYNDCSSDEISFLINEDNPIEVENISSPLYENNLGISCYNESDGAINVDVSGGEGNLEFIWTLNGLPFDEDTEDLTGLGPGIYNLIIHFISSSTSPVFIAKRCPIINSFLAISIPFIVIEYSPGVSSRLSFICKGGTI